MAKNSAAGLLTSVDSMFTTQEERDNAQRSYVTDLPIAEISDFPNHPFHVKIDEEMERLVESVKERGVLSAVLVRPMPDGGYQMVSGHRRKRAAELAELPTVPCIVRELTDDEAIIIMVDSNLQRERVLPSEKAFAYKMKLDAMKRQGERVDLTSTPAVSKLRSNEVVGAQGGESREQVRRYIRLTNLVPELLDMVDNTVLKEKGTLHHSKITRAWNIEGKSQDKNSIKASNTYGTGRINAYKIIEETLNQRDVRIFDYIQDENGKKKPVLNKKETAIAQGKQELIKQAFQDWIWKDPQRREQLTQLYNTGHYHNHFVINSVSWADGYKFYNSPADYARMREVSDRLCREYAISVIENPGGRAKHYWSWYGFNSRVEWCACFVSWCANECGYLDAGVIPKTAGCISGSNWFKDRGLWQDNSYEPRPGDIIYFDWDNKGSSGPQDGLADHVGIVEKVENGLVYTVEGNSGDSCRENRYAVGHYEIYGYGTPAY